MIVGFCLQCDAWHDGVELASGLTIFGCPRVDVRSFARGPTEIVRVHVDRDTDDEARE